MEIDSMDDPGRIQEIRSLIHSKRFLNLFYQMVYNQFAAVLSTIPEGGIVLELGSGGGFIKDVIPEVVTSDVIRYEGVDQVVDATKMPFKDGSLRALFMLNVFHHIPDVEAFLAECARCLKPYGKLFIVDQNKGWISQPILTFMHHEAYAPGAKSWRFESRGPLSSANGALAWIVFQRDFAIFEQRYPLLKMKYYRPHSPLAYWLSGGLKKWTLVSGSMFTWVQWLDKLLVFLNPKLGSFVTIEIERVSQGPAEPQRS